MHYTNGFCHDFWYHIKSRGFKRILLILAFNNRSGKWKACEDRSWRILARFSFRIYEIKSFSKFHFSWRSHHCWKDLWCIAYYLMQCSSGICVRKSMDFSWSDRTVTQLDSIVEILCNYWWSIICNDKRQIKIRGLKT